MCLSVTITDHFYVVPGGKPGLVWWVCPKSMGKPWLCYKNCHKLRLGPHFQHTHLHSRVRLFDTHSSYHPMGSISNIYLRHVSTCHAAMGQKPCSPAVPPQIADLHYRSSSSSLVNHHGFTMVLPCFWSQKSNISMVSPWFFLGSSHVFWSPRNLYGACSGQLCRIGRGLDLLPRATREKPGDFGWKKSCPSG